LAFGESENHSNAFNYTMKRQRRKPLCPLARAA
jgi:hypothetical protein